LESSIIWNELKFWSQKNSIVFSDHYNFFKEFR
jgi:hypothetical protein